MIGPVCNIVAGPNGAGKTTFAMNYLQAMGCPRFINADLIASGLSPLAPDDAQLQAGRLFLDEIAAYRRRREDFSFETTLSGRSYLRFVRMLQAEGWRVRLYYLWLPSVMASVARVAERVSEGGHDIPLHDIHRRYPRSVGNLLDHYAVLCDNTLCMDNSGGEPLVIFEQDSNGRRIIDTVRYRNLVNSRGHTRD